MSIPMYHWALVLVLDVGLCEVKYQVRYSNTLGLITLLLGYIGEAPMEVIVGYFSYSQCR